MGRMLLYGLAASELSGASHSPRSVVAGNRLRPFAAVWVSSCSSVSPLTPVDTPMADESSRIARSLEPMPSRCQETRLVATSLAIGGDASCSGCELRRELAGNLSATPSADLKPLYLMTDCAYGVCK